MLALEPRADSSAPLGIGGRLSHWCAAAALLRSDRRPGGSSSGRRLPLPAAPTTRERVRRRRSANRPTTRAPRRSRTRTLGPEGDARAGPRPGGSRCSSLCRAGIGWCRTSVCRCARVSGWRLAAGAGRCVRRYCMWKLKVPTSGPSMYPTPGTFWELAAFGPL